MYKCNLCNANFSSTQRLRYHINNNVCKILTKDYHCSICNKYYKSKYNLLRHLNYKHKEKNKKLKCQYCQKEFTRKYNLVNHEKNICKVKKHINEYISKNNKLVRNKKSTNIINNTINNIVNINNITINSFGDENIKRLTKEDILYCINRCYSSIPELFKKIHIDIPENRNLYLSNIKDSYMYLYKNNKWELNECKKILSNIKTDKKDIIEQYFTEYNNMFNERKRLRIIKMLKELDNGILDQKNEKKIKLILMNNKDLLKDYYRNSK